MNSVRERSTVSEFLLVLGIAFGYPVLWSLNALLVGNTDSGVVFKDNGLMGLIVYEIIALAFVSMFLRSRGWTLKDLNIDVNWRLTGFGIVLLIGIQIVTAAIQWGIGMLHIVDVPKDIVSSASQVSLAVAIIVSVVNPVFEETVVTGYVMESLWNRQSTGLAINISVGVRLLYHLYQGAFGVITIIPIGLAFAYTYRKLRKLWPVVLAHGLNNLIGFIAIHFGV